MIFKESTNEKIEITLDVGVVVVVAIVFSAVVISIYEGVPWLYTHLLSVMMI